MEKCKNCGGEGIVGAGDFPLAKQGPLTTCESCGGTGKGVESVAEEAAPVEAEAAPEAEESLPAESEEAGGTSEGDEVPA